MMSSPSWRPVAAYDVVYQHPHQMQHLEPNWAIWSPKGVGSKDSWELVADRWRPRIKGDAQLGSTEAAGMCLEGSGREKRRGKKAPGGRDVRAEEPKTRAFILTSQEQITPLLRPPARDAEEDETPPESLCRA